MAIDLRSDVPSLLASVRRRAKVFSSLRIIRLRRLRFAVFRISFFDDCKFAICVRRFLVLSLAVA